MASKNAKNLFRNSIATSSPSSIDSSEDASASDGPPDGAEVYDFVSIKKRLAKKKKEERLTLKSERRHRRQDDSDLDDSLDGDTSSTKKKKNMKRKGRASTGGLSSSLRLQSTNLDDEGNDANLFTEGDEELSKHFKLEKMRLVGKIGAVQKDMKNASDSTKASLQKQLISLMTELKELDQSIKRVEEKRTVTMMTVREAQEQEQKRHSTHRDASSVASSMTATMIKKLKLDMMKLAGKIGQASSQAKSAKDESTRAKFEKEGKELAADLKRLEMAIKTLEAKSMSSSVAANSPRGDRQIDSSDREMLFKVYEHTSNSSQKRRHWTVALRSRQSCAELCDKLCDMRGAPIGSFVLHQCRPDGTGSTRLANEARPDAVRGRWKALNEFIFVAVPRESSKRVALPRSARASPRVSISGPPSIPSDDNFDDDGDAPPPALPELPADMSALKTPRRVDTRDTVIAEIVETEKCYVADLTVVVKDYAECIASKKLLDNKARSGIFRTVSAILKTHEGILKKIEENTAGTLAGLSSAAETYYIYCAGASNARVQLARATASNAEFVTFCAKIQSTTSGTCVHSLQSLLRRPLDRLFEYDALVKRLVAVSDAEHDDAAALKKAQKVFKKLCSVVPSTERPEHGVLPLWTLSLMLDGVAPELDLAGLKWSAHHAKPVNAPPSVCRTVLAEAQLSALYDGAPRTFHLFLLSDMLVLTSPISSSSGRYRYRGSLRLDGEAEFAVDGDADDAMVLSHVSDWPVAMRVQHRNDYECGKWLDMMRRQVLQRALLYRQQGNDVDTEAWRVKLSDSKSDQEQLVEARDAATKAQASVRELCTTKGSDAGKVLLAHNELLSAARRVEALIRRVKA